MRRKDPRTINPNRILRARYSRTSQIYCPILIALSVSPQQLFDVVADVDRYKEFLPFCTDSRVIKRSDKELKAELAVGFRFLEERYTSIIELDPYKSIKVGSS